MLTTILKPFDTLVILVSTSSSITLSFTGIGLIVIPILTGIACGLESSKNVILKIVVQKYIKYKERSQKDPQKIKSFDKLFRKSLEVNVIDKSDYESLCNVLTEYMDDTKNESFFKIMNIKLKTIFLNKITQNST